MDMKISIEIHSQFIDLNPNDRVLYPFSMLIELVNEYHVPLPAFGTVVVGSESAIRRSFTGFRHSGGGGI